MSEAGSNPLCDEDDNRYLLFKLGSELYGTPLLGVREVVEPQPSKPIPNTASYYTGVINIRGEIVGVIDLRLRFGQPQDEHPLMALMVFDTESGPLAAQVDKVEAVVTIPDAQIDREPQVQTTAPIEFLIGIGQHEERLVSLIDLNRTLGSEEVAQIAKMSNL